MPFTYRSPANPNWSISTASGPSKNRSLPHPVYAGLVEEVDDQVGRIVRALDALGLTNDTMVVFTSDNGGLNKRYDYDERVDDVVSDLTPLKGEKGSLHEEESEVPPDR